MEVNDALFPSKYEPHEIKIKYKDETIKLIPVLEEMAIFLERVIDIDYSKRDGNKNFAKKIRKIVSKKNSTKGKNETDNLFDLILFKDKFILINYEKAYFILLY